MAHLQGKKIAIIATDHVEESELVEPLTGVSLVNENGNQIGDPAERVADAEKPLVTLNPGDRTQAALTVANSDNLPDGECKDGATKLRVYPPNNTGYLSVGTVYSWERISAEYGSRCRVTFCSVTRTSCIGVSLKSGLYPLQAVVKRTCHWPS